MRTRLAPFGSYLAFLNAAVVVSALGYFVDVFDLYVFSLVRVRSLQDLGITGEDLTKTGLFLMNMQMCGMLLGGIMWGILGDRKGRIKVLLGSILLYSVANIANAFVHGVNSYALWRFLAGVGLAGEIGAGITLVSESIPKEKRGIGTTIVATVGVSGAIAASLIVELLPWRVAYFAGGVMGLALLVMRASVYESKMFEKIQTTNIARGKFFSFFTNAKRFKKYICCILMGIPVWFLMGILVTLSPEISPKMNVQGTIQISYVLMATSIGITVGDFCTGLLSQFLRSRRKAMLFMLFGNAFTMTAFFTYGSMSPVEMYMLYAVMGFFCGLWVLIVTVAAELFGTNLRATAAATVPNFVRGSLVILNLAVVQFRNAEIDILTASQIIGAVVMVIAIIAVYLLPETFHDDLDYQEKIK